MKPAIVAVGYNRPHALQRLLDSIKAANYTEGDIPLIISLDKADNEQEVVAVAENFEWLHGEKMVRRFPERQGLRKHVLACGDLTECYDAVIILEDDLVVAPDFYEYTQQALTYYKGDECITGVALYGHEWNGYARRNFVPVADEYDTYLGQYSITWGQCWTKKWWTGFKTWYAEHEDRLADNPAIPCSINHWSDRSWGKYFVNYIVEQNKFYVIPRVARSTNCSDLGEHVRIADNVHQVRLMTGTVDSYQFAPVCSAQRYDIFFENMKLQEHFSAELQAAGVVVDLAGYGRQMLGKRYLLSTQLLPYTIVQSYGLQLRPYEMNVLLDVPGKDIYVYDTHTPDKKPNGKSNASVMRYELRGFSLKDLLQYVAALFIQRVKNRLFARRR